MSKVTMKQTFKPDANARVEKLAIGSTDDTSLVVEAQYNPHTIQVDKNVTWAKHKATRDDKAELEFSGADGRSLSIELMFDGYENSESVQPPVEALVKMATPRKSADQGGNNQEKRPHMVQVVWGNGKFPSFSGVLEQVSTKYTMFLPDGTPCRATVNVKVKEAKSATFKKGT